MNIVDLIPKELIIPEIHAARKPDVIRELAGCLAERGGGAISRADIVRVFLQRERQGSTAIGEGIAIPHGKLDSITELRACLGRSRKGVDFGSVDGKPTHFFLALIAPKDSAGRHLKVLARFIHLFRDAAFRADLMSAKTADEIHEAIAEEDAR